MARTNLAIILTKSKKEQIEQNKLISTIQAMANSNMSEERVLNETSSKFRNLIESIYASKPVIDKEDIQKGRWGGNAKVGDYVLEGKYLQDGLLPNVYQLSLSIVSLNVDNPLTGEVAFFIHDTFPKEIVYQSATNNKAEITLYAYEAFVVGARLENGIELELDLNANKKVFPEGFYW